MKSISTMIKSVALASVLMVSSAFSANAAIIKQDLIADADTDPILIGTFEIELDEALLNTGLIDTAFDEGISLLSFEILGTAFTPDQLDTAFFEVALDSDNLAAGLEVLFFDIEESGFANNWTYQVAFDAFNPGGNIIDIFDSFGNLIFFSFDVSLGQAVVTVPDPEPVSAPATIALLTLALGGLLLRRKA